ncbi:hypothetical protein sce0915 [Sorangium cellulosum So ce56]|uniref:Uncharacterized protein n=1 Tax=Sorangium cellulosum (strain So ce56) TaxID=448385 RepID=A9EU68_SORC5|nr:hypothetical protein sce0915 [Sorangium cellulosum So ce56]
MLIHPCEPWRIRAGRSAAKVLLVLRRDWKAIKMASS